MAIAELLVRDDTVAFGHDFHRATVHELPFRRAILGEPILAGFFGPGVEVFAVEEHDRAAGRCRAERRGDSIDVLEIEAVGPLAAAEVRLLDFAGPTVAGEGDDVIRRCSFQNGERLVFGVESLKQIRLITSICGREDLRNRSAFSFPVADERIRFGGDEVDGLLHLLPSFDRSLIRSQQRRCKQAQHGDQFDPSHSYPP